MLSSEFWAHFAEHYWEKRPLVITQPFVVPLATPEETFQTLVKATNQYLAGDRSFLLDFYIEYAKLITGVGTYLPVSQDMSVVSYAARVSHQIQGRRFGLVAEDFHIHSAEIWLRIRELFHGLFAFIGIPGEKATSALFLGNYEKTPYGLHVGEAGSFKLVIEGRKRVRVWPPHYFRDKKDVTPDYERFLDGSIVLEGDPGDVFYWPSGFAHVGESVDGGLVMSITVALFMDSRASIDLSEAAKMVENRLEGTDAANLYPVRCSTIQESAEKLPQVLEIATKALRDASRDSQLKQDMQIQWLNRLSSCGFAKVPPPLPSEPMEDDRIVRGDPHYPILRLLTDDSEMLCSANGHAFSVAAHPHILKLLERLNRGEACAVKNLMEEYAGTVVVEGTELEATPEDIRALLVKLYSLRAITFVAD